MTQHEIWETLRGAAAAEYPPHEARAIADRILDEHYGISRIQRLLEPRKRVDCTVSSLEQLTEELLRCRPVQYILGQTQFCGHIFFTREGVLIPRPETEELVALILRQEGDRPALSVLDIGTGSGCIAISLAAAWPHATITAVDISSQALTLATENATHNDVHVHFEACNILLEDPTGQFDLIVSNPPYITESEKKLMRNNVLCYEPHEALFVADDDPLLFYRTIAQRTRRMLRPKGTLYFEINETYAPQTLSMLYAEGYDALSYTDLFDKPRMIKAWIRND